LNNAFFHGMYVVRDLKTVLFDLLLKSENYCIDFKTSGRVNKNYCFPDGKFQLFVKKNQMPGEK